MVDFSFFFLLVLLAGVGMQSLKALTRAMSIGGPGEEISASRELYGAK
jgi:hypothetical protein